MEWLIIALAAFGASMLTFFSGFGLGTILLPVFALFFPVDVSIALTAVVHFLNNIFKTGLIGRHAVRDVVLRFGIPALLFAALGALALDYLSSFPIQFPYKLLGFSLVANVLDLVIGLLLIAFAIAEIVPMRKRKPVKPAQLYIGGALSGFFGGLSGHQGALRSGFLIRLGLSKEAFVATGIVISLFVDVSRITVYAGTGISEAIFSESTLLLVAILAAFAGAIIGRRLLKKITLRALQYIVAAGIMIIGVLMAVGAL